MAALLLHVRRVRVTDDTATAGSVFDIVYGDQEAASTLLAFSGSSMLPTDLGAAIFSTRMRSRRGMRRFAMLNTLKN